jgi:hypothetical protein
MDRRERRQARRQVLSRALKYARSGKSLDELQADILDEAEESDGDITIWITLLTTLLPLLLDLFQRFRK